MYSFPPSIKPLINKLVYKEKYGIVIHKKNVYFDFVSAVPIPPHVPQAAADVVRFLWPYRKCREHSFTAEFFFCDAPKILPEKGVTLEEDHVNTGYSIPCESLVVFRKQEWFKVFIHECFHYLGLDKGLAETVELHMFNLPIAVCIRESFCEVWARLVQSKFLGGLPKERIHSVRNMVRVLRHNGLVYSDLWQEKALNYKENTNVFAYVMLSAILMHDTKAFVEAFPRMVGKVSTLMDLIYRNYKAPAFLRRVAKAEAEPSEKGPFRMSVVELNF